VFRVDNPHTKSFDFWEWCIAELKAKHPETVFWPKRSPGRA
jgi:starch synthase (maltosyl-transferring)